MRLASELDRRLQLTQNAMVYAKVLVVKSIELDKEYRLVQKLVALLTTLVTAFLHAIKAFQETPSPYSTPQSPPRELKHKHDKSDIENITERLLESLESLNSA
jgi:hypothetical protein